MTDDFAFSTTNIDKHQVACLKNGTVINDRYRIHRVLGAGGMGIVYQAEDITISTSNQRAIKETPTPLKDPPTSIQLRHIKALQMEYSIMTKLQHDAIPRVHDTLEWQRHHYLVMDYIDGVTLHDKLMAQLKEYNKPFDLSMVLLWMRDICSLFDYLHHQNPPIIYRDCKPTNLILTTANEIKLIDFGIARYLLQNELSGTLMGTEGYTAPEIYERRRCDERTDIFSLGAMMHALLTGVDPGSIPPFMWPEHRPRRYRKSLPTGIDELIMRCLERDPNDRWHNVRELNDALYLLSQSLGLREQLTEDDPNRSLYTLSTAGNSSIIGPDLSSSIIAQHKQQIGDVRMLCAMSPKLVWRYETQGNVRSSPQIYNGTVYFGSHDTHLYALDAQNGELKGTIAATHNICSDPIVTEQSVIFGAEDGRVYAVDRGLTHTRWRYATGKPIVSSPTILGDMVVIGSDDGKVYGIPLEGEKPRWNFETYGPVRGQLTTVGKLVLFGSHDQRIYALDDHGRKIWVKTTRDIVDAAPIVKNGIAIIGGQDRYVYAISAEDGTLIWQTPLEDSILTAAAASEHYIYVGSSDGRITCLTMKGSVRWRYFTGSQITSDIVLRGNRLYFGCADGSIYCLDTQQHEIIWRYLTGDSVVTRPAFNGHLVIVGSLDHHIYALYDKGYEPQG
jgi:eukaryotic-like serine/threonine-protein kinase